MEIRVNKHKVIKSNFLFLKSGIKLEPRVLEELKGKRFLEDYIAIAKCQFKSCYFDIILKPYSFNNYIYFQPLFPLKELNGEELVIKEIEIIIF